MKNKRQNGEVVVEASIVVTLAIIFISIMLYIGMVLYQQTLISVMANQTASNIAQVYSNNLKDAFTGYLDSDNIYQSITYSNMKTDAYLDVIRQKANVFAQYRLKSSSILAAESTTVDVDVIKKPNELLKSQIVVTIRSTYDVPLVGIFGANGMIEFASSGRADCVDLLEYLNGVPAISDPSNSSVPSLPDSDTCLVTFVTDRYTGGFYAVVPVLRGKSIITSNHFSHSVMPENPVRNDRKFTGWKIEDGRNFTASMQINENITVYGSWECVVSFNPDGGTVNPTSKKGEFMKTMQFPIPQKDGYAFEGWFTEKNGGGEQYFSNVTEIIGNVTLYAKWRCLHKNCTSTKISDGNCIVRSRWKYSCTRCPHTYEAEGAFGAHIRGDEIGVFENPTCQKTGIGKYKCRLCPAYIEDVTLDIVDHNYSRCGIRHWTLNPVADDCSYAAKEPGTQYYHSFECKVCRWCKKLQGTKYRTLNNGKKMKTSDKVWCWDHIEKEGLVSTFDDSDLYPKTNPGTPYH